MKTIIEKTFKPTMSEFPVWKIDRKVKTRCFEFDTISSAGVPMGKTRLLWKHDTNNHEYDPIYHGCSYHFDGYNPTPCTDWFHGIPLKQMLNWCENNGMTNMKLLWEHIDITYKDTSYEATHPDF